MGLHSDSVYLNDGSEYMTNEERDLFIKERELKNIYNSPFGSEYLVAQNIIEETCLEVMPPQFCYLSLNNFINKIVELKFNEYEATRVDEWNNAVSFLVASEILAMEDLSIVNLKSYLRTTLIKYRDIANRDIGDIRPVKDMNTKEKVVFVKAELNRFKAKQSELNLSYSDAELLYKLVNKQMGIGRWNWDIECILRCMSVDEINRWLNK